MEWIQAWAAAHWQLLSTALQSKENTWVVMRHEIDFLAAAFEGGNWKTRPMYLNVRVPPELDKLRL